MPTQTTQLVMPHEVRAPHLSLAEQVQLLSALNGKIMGYPVFVSFQYTNQTDAKRSEPGQDYRPLPGVALDTFIGPIIGVYRRVDNRANRRAGVVGQVYFTVATCTRGDASERERPRSHRPSGVRNFQLTMAPPPEPE